MSNALIPYGTSHEFDELCEPEYQTANIAAVRIHYGLDDLVTTFYNEVRIAVAEEGYGLDVLINDKAERVREAAQKYLDDNGYESLDDWKKKNPDMVYENDRKRIEALKAEKAAAGTCLKIEDFAERFDELARTSNDENILRALAASDWNYDALIENPCRKAHVMLAKYGHHINDAISDKLLQLNDSAVNYSLACNMWYKGSALEKLANSEDVDIRRVIAEKGCCLDKLINDEDVTVRTRVVDQDYGLDALMNDKDPEVRRRVALRGYGLETLIDDNDCDVRCAVARRGYGLDKLANDENSYVKSAVKEALLKDSRYVGVNLERWIQKHTDKCVLPENKVKNNIPDTVDEPEGNDGEDRQYE